MVNFQPEKGAILANATPIGMHPNTDRIPVAEVLFPLLSSSKLEPYFSICFPCLTLFVLFFRRLLDYQLVFNSVYTPRKTRLLKEAEATGAIIVSGVEMFLRQAIGQFNLFTGGEVPLNFLYFFSHFHLILSSWICHIDTD